jgi:hypothetical protein
MDKSYEFKGLVADTLYMIVLRTVDASGNVSTGATLAARTQAAQVVTPPTTPITPTLPGPVIEIPTNPTPAPSGGGGAAIILPSVAQDPVVQQATATLEKAKKSLTIVDYVSATTAIKSLTDEEKREEFQKDLEKLKQELDIKNLPAKNEMRPAVPVAISLEVAMKSSNYKYVDVASIQTQGASQNVFVLNSKGERLENVEVKVLFNRLVIMPKNDGKFDSKEIYTIVIGTTVKGKASIDSKENFELKNPLMLEFTTR